MNVTTIGVHKGRILIRYAPYEMTPVLRNLPGVSYDGAIQSWAMPAGSETGRQAIALFPDAEFHSSFDSIREAIRREEMAMGAKVCPISLLPEIPVLATTPWSHQLRAFWFLYHKLGLTSPEPSGGAMLAMDMGTGKTKVSIDLIQNLPGSLPRFILVGCPLAVVATWPEELDTHYSGVAPLRVLPLAKGSVEKRSQECKRVLEQCAELGQSAVIVINHESLWREPFRSFLLKRRPDLFILDECHRAKSPGGKLSQFVGMLHSRVPLRVGLTGTPMPRDHMDYYAQARFLDQSYFGTSYTEYASRYGKWIDIETKKKDKRGKIIVVKKLLGVKNAEEYQRKIDAMTYRVMADDVLDLPPALFMTRTCELGPKERKAYDEFKREMIVQIENGFLTANNGLVKLLRLQQIVQGYVEDDEGRKHEVGDSKRRLLKDVLTDLDKDEPVVVFCRFHTDLDQVASVAADLDRGCLELSGRVNQLEEFKKGGGPIIAVQIQSGGVGVDLSRAAYTVYFSPTYDMGAYDQSLRRTRRPTKHRHDKFFYYHLVAENTIDRLVYQALRNKKNLVETVLSGIRGEK